MLVIGLGFCNVSAVQTFIVHLLRTERWPFVQSNATWPLQLSSFGTMAVGIAVCYIPGMNSAFQLTEIDVRFYGFLVALVIGYSLTMQVFKFVYIKVFKSWL